MTSYISKCHLKNCHATKIYKNDIGDLVRSKSIS